MELKKFERAKKTYDRIQAIDREIEVYNKVGEIMAAYPSKSNWTPLLTLHIPDPRKMIQPPQMPQPDEDGFVIVDGRDIPLEMAIGMNLVDPNAQPKVSIQTFQKHIPDTLAFRVLGLLLSDLIEEKAMLMNRMETIGIRPNKKVTKTILKRKKIV